MNHSITTSISLTAVLGVVACSSVSTSTTLQDVGGSVNTGGSASAAGGKSSTVSSVNTGGTPSTGGGSSSSAVASGGLGNAGGGASAAGGRSSNGGIANSSGGSSSGGAGTGVLSSSIGGKSSAGGSANTGGIAGQSGGASSGGVTSGVAGGVTSSGGSSSPGGKSSTGGIANNSGGASAVATGGTAGGNGTGRSAAAGGGSAGSSSTSTLTLPILVTSTASALWQNGTISTTTSGTATITVSDSDTYQTFNGFGGCFNEKGWYYLKQLAASDQSKAMSLLFDPKEGANFQYGRIPIGANDYSVTPYSEDDTSNDTALTNFSITEDEKYIIPYIQAAQAVNPNIHFWGSPWSPPGWMKTGADSGNLGLNGGTMKNDTATFTAYASYFVKWVQAYAAKSITIEAVAPQNEPNYAESYPSCAWKAADYDSFVGKFLGPAIKAAGLDTGVILGTMSRNDTNTGTGESDQSVVTKVLGDSTAMGFIKAIGLQWNMMQSGAFSPSAISSASAPKWQTEHKCGNYSWGGAAYGQAYNSGTAPNDFGYAEESWGNIHDWLKAGVNVYSAWNMVLDPKGLSVANWPQDTLIVADPTAKTLTPKPAYYAFRHFSQYTKPGATRVGTTGDVSCSGDGIGKCSAGVAATAFKNPDGTHVVVLFNTNSSSAQVVLGIGSTKLQFTMAGTSFATVVN